jgi:transcription-repair coupling factor (superfamily II helicase)
VVKLPKDRMAIQTVGAYDEKLVKSALEHELERGGQLSFTIAWSLSTKSRPSSGDAAAGRVIVGHGQMSKANWKVMFAFVRHETDILVATIIENGLDIPLCNTIIINRSDRHGLSELYQLRGRVGRSNRALMHISWSPRRAHACGAAASGGAQRVLRSWRGVQDCRS